MPKTVCGWDYWQWCRAIAETGSEPPRWFGLFIDSTMATELMAIKEKWLAAYSPRTEPDTLEDFLKGME